MRVFRFWKGHLQIKTLFLKMILIGPKYAGKTITGREIARILNLNFIDSDLVIEQTEKKSPRKIVADSGWRYFRKIENKAIKNLSEIWTGQNIVISTGGGAIAHEFEDIRKENLVSLKKLGPIVLILPSEKPEDAAKIILERMKTDSGSPERASLTGKSPKEEVLDVLQKRWNFYHNSSDITLYTNHMNEKEVAEEIVRRLKIEQKI